MWTAWAQVSRMLDQKWFTNLCAWPQSRSTKSFACPGGISLIISEKLF